MSWGDCWVKANRVLGGHGGPVGWKRYGLRFVHARTQDTQLHKRTSQASLRKQAECTCQHVDIKAKRQAQMLVMGSYPPEPPPLHPPSPPDPQTQPLIPPHLCSRLIVFVVSGLGLLLIPCGAFGCSAITLNGFHTFTAKKVCVCDCACVWLQARIRVKNRG